MFVFVKKNLARIIFNPFQDGKKTMTYADCSSDSFGRFCITMCFFEAGPQFYRREPSNQLSLLKGGIEDRKLICDPPFASLPRSCSLPRAQDLFVHC